MSLLLRLYDPQEGRILINDVDLREFLIEDLRANSAIAMQKNVLFTGKVASNIAFGRQDIGREAVVEAAKISCAHDFIEELDGGYDSELGDRGSKLSSGQRQRLTIARAVVRDTQILILDELMRRSTHARSKVVSATYPEWGREKIVFFITSHKRLSDRLAQCGQHSV